MALLRKFRDKLVDKRLLSRSKPVELATSSHSAGVRIIRSAAGDRQHAATRNSDFVLGGGRRDLGGGNCTGEDKDGDEGADELFHSEVPLKLYSQEKICMDKANEVTIGYIME